MHKTKNLRHIWVLYISVIIILGWFFLLSHRSCVQYFKVFPTIFYFQVHHFHSNWAVLKLIIISLIFGGPLLLTRLKFRKLSNYPTALLLFFSWLVNSILIFIMSFQFGINLAIKITVILDLSICVYFILCGKPLNSRWRSALVVDIFLPYFLAYLIFAPVILKPELSYDATLYHIASAKNYVFLDHFKNLYSMTHMFQLGTTDWNSIWQTIAIKVCGIQAATFLSFFEMLLVIELCRQILANTFGRRLALCIPFILISVPMFSWAGSHGYSDMASSLYVTSYIYLIFIYSRSHQIYVILLCQFLTGVGFLFKFTSGYVSLLMLVVTITKILAIKSDFRKKLFSRNMIILQTLFLAMGFVPLFIYEYFLTGNPFYPYLFRFFPTTGYTPLSLKIQKAFFSSNGGHLPVRNLFFLPYYLFNNKFQIEGYAGPISILFILIGMYGWILCLKYKLNDFTQILLYVSGLSIFGISVLMQTNLRYLVVIFPVTLIALALCYSQMDFGKKRNTVRLLSRKIILSILFVCSLVFSPLFVNTTTSSKDSNAIGPLEYDYSYASGKYEIRDFISKAYPAVSLLNKNGKNSDTVLDLCGVERLSMYVKPIIMDGQQWTSPVVNGLVSLESVNAATRLKSFGVKFICFDQTSLSRLRNESFFSSLHYDDSLRGFYLFSLK